ncbi:hypothetical protein UFOVP353_23 [uncultured Caudovirales phage]|uniref:Uncharacterized protein n=1 Tax=uncultured Caudovirales phage TaxID=2100421 RepID=A0A6J5M2J4_9CAUD|nr:hypothetical protein UFOVP353_23 [uncultured Caudovirales phage]
MTTEYIKAHDELTQWLAAYRHLLDERDIDGLDDVFSSLRGGHQSKIDDLIFDGTIPVSKGEYHDERLTVSSQI